MKGARFMIPLAVLGMAAVGCSAEVKLAAPDPLPTSIDEPPARITVVEPQEGATVPDRFTVRGEASVYEGTVVLRVRDPVGRVALSRFTTATEGAPGRGTWSRRITMPSGPAGTWMIEAVEESPDDGSDAFVVRRTVQYAGRVPSNEPTEVARITITTPQEGAVVAGTITIGGEASVFEANVTIRLLDPNGTLRRETFATATEGAPGRGDWSTEIRIPNQPKGTWTIEAVEVSAEDGSDAYVTARHVRVARSG